MKGSKVIGTNAKTFLPENVLLTFHLLNHTLRTQIQDRLKSSPLNVFAEVTNDENGNFNGVCRVTEQRGESNELS